MQERRTREQLKSPPGRPKNGLSKLPGSLELEAAARCAASTWCTILAKQRGANTHLTVKQ